MNKGDSPDGSVVVVMTQKEEEHEEYIGDAFIDSEGMDIISYDEWILDSGCPIHICSMREYFDEF